MPPNSQPAAAPSVHLHQIAWSPKTLAQVEPGYRVLDNLANPRPDWYEYWPIRRFLQEEQLDEEAFYGFFSTKFGHKSGLGHAEVVQKVQTLASRADVVLFSGYPAQIAFFLNVFEQGESAHPGLMEVAQAWLESCGIRIPLERLVMDSHQMVFSNSFVARPAFWREWLTWNETLFALCETQDTPLSRRLTGLTRYDGKAQLKVFLMERMAPLILSLQQRRWRVRSHNPYARPRPWPDDKLAMMELPQILCFDALKHAFVTFGYPEYLEAIDHMREQFQPDGQPIVKTA